MKTISIRKLHEKIGDWFRRNASVLVVTKVATNPFAARKLRKGYATLRGKLEGGVDSARSVSEDRDSA